jgi:hypothetical protein
VGGTLELTSEARGRLKELQALSDKVESGENGALLKLRRAVQQSSPEVIAFCANIAQDYRRMPAEIASGGDPLAKEAIVERAELLAQEIAGENASPLEVLLAGRVASLWVLAETQEALLFAWYQRGKAKHTSPTYLLQMCKVQESVNRRYLQAIKTLAQVRKLQANTPGVQFNTQINVG